MSERERKISLRFKLACKNFKPWGNVTRTRIAVALGRLAALPRIGVSSRIWCANVEIHLALMTDSFP